MLRSCHCSHLPPKRDEAALPRSQLPCKWDHHTRKVGTKGTVPFGGCPGVYHLECAACSGGRWGLGCCPTLELLKVWGPGVS